MIDVNGVLRDSPAFEGFCSVQKLHELVESLRSDERFTINEVGTSRQGVPIHHVCFGRGRVKALFVAFPHCMEPVGGLTVYALMSLLHGRCGSLLRADVEWHIVPCIDPDGALLNEGWSLQQFSLDNFMRNFYLQSFQDQADNSFPLSYKNLKLEQEPSKEAAILRSILERVRPDFYFDLHNHFFGGAFYLMSRDIGAQFYREIYRLLEELGIQVQKRPPYAQLASFSPGIGELCLAKTRYESLAKRVPSPERHVKCASSFDYLEQIKPEAMTLIAEIGLVRHPDDESEAQTGENLRRFKLRMEADGKYLATVLREEWERVKDDVDTTNPLYRVAALGYFLPDEDRLLEGGTPLMADPTRDILFNPQHSRGMTKGDRFNACIYAGGFFFLFQSYQVVRLLRESPQTPAIRQAVSRLEAAYDEVLREIKRHVDFSSFEAVDHTTLAKVQLGSGLIVLNSVLERKSEAA